MSIKTPEAVIFDGEVLQHPTTPVMNETNMKKNEQINKAIIDLPMSENSKILYFYLNYNSFIIRTDSGHVFCRKLLGGIFIIRNVVVYVVTPSLNR